MENTSRLGREAGRRAAFAVGFVFAACALCSCMAAPAKSAVEKGAPPVRIAYNYCTLSYTFAYYSEKEWEAEIVRLANAGYNAALVTDGTYKVWQETLLELGYSQDEILRFIPDECARAWWLMGNLTGEGGPLDQATIDADAALGRFICSKMREKGIEPILQGFVGMMPLNHPKAIAQGKWNAYERPPALDPTSREFAEAAAVWHRSLEAVYGCKPKYLAGDLFHEGGNPGGIDVTAATRAVQSAQQAAFPGVTWVVQAWQRNPTPAVRAGLDPRFTLVEALAFDVSSLSADDAACELEYGALPWVWCEVVNFGGNHGLYGNLKTLAHMGRAANGKGAATFRGYGSLSEGFFTNPVCSDLFEHMMTQPAGTELSDAQLDEWLRDWAAKRYASDDPGLHEAWRILAETAYACPSRQEGAVDNIVCAKPSWTPTHARTWAPKTGLYYDPSKLERALALMEQSPARENPTDAFRRDLYDLRRQVKANRLRILAPRLKDDAAARDEFIATAKSMCGKDDDVPQEFRLSYWEGLARHRAGERGVKAWRRMITTWHDPKYGESTLNDYANREYPELVREYYLPRWLRFFASQR